MNTTQTILDALIYGVTDNKPMKDISHKAHAIARQLPPFSELPRFPGTDVQKRAWEESLSKAFIIAARATEPIPHEITVAIEEVKDAIASKKATVLHGVEVFYMETWSRHNSKRQFNEPSCESGGGWMFRAFEREVVNA